MNQSPKKLYKSRRDRMIDGVCGGLAEYLNVDSTIVRIIWVLVTFMGGAGIIIYIAAMIIVPVNPDHISTTVPTTTPQSSKGRSRKKKPDTQHDGSSAGAVAHSGSNARKFWGALFVIVGACILLINLDFFNWYWFRWWDLSWSVVFPLTLILAGAALIYHNYAQGRVSSAERATEGERARSGESKTSTDLRRSKTDKKVFGVCGGLAKYLRVDSTIVRLVYIILTLASLGVGILLYLVMALVMPEEQ